MCVCVLVLRLHGGGVKGCFCSHFFVGVFDRLRKKKNAKVTQKSFWSTGRYRALYFKLISVYAKHSDRSSYETFLFFFFVSFSSEKQIRTFLLPLFFCYLNHFCQFPQEGHPRQSMLSCSVDFTPQVHKSVMEIAVSHF